jgi:HEPN domain-containing protein
LNRWRDWWDQSQRDLAHARHAIDDADHEWAAFAAQQAAEKAVKALILACAGEPWGHSVTHLVQSLPGNIEVAREIVEASNRLDMHYIPARYPNGFSSGHPGEYYNEPEARQALRDAAEIIQFCRRHLPQ